MLEGYKGKVKTDESYIIDTLLKGKIVEKFENGILHFTDGITLEVLASNCVGVYYIIANTK